MYEKQSRYRQKNKMKIKKAMSNYLLKRKAFIAQVKNKPCMDCGGWYEPVQMDFDHRPNEKKLFTISQRYCWKLSYIYKEIQKCDLVCANCHRLRTAKRGQNAVNTNGSFHRNVNNNELSKHPKPN